MLCLHESGVMFSEANRALICGSGLLPDGSGPFFLATTILCKTITEQVAETFQGQIRIFKSKIPNTVKVGESVYYSEPLIEYAPESNACKAYEKLAGEEIAYEG